MPWLIVLGTGSWSAPGVSKTTFKASVCKAQGHGYKVEQAVADEALATGYAWLQVFEDDDEPFLDVSDPTGPLDAEDVRVGVQGGVRLHVVEGGAEPEPEWVDPEAPPLIHGCQWCSRKFPVSAARDRHIEFEHTHRHETAVAEAIDVHEQMKAEKAALQRLADADEALPAWEREAAGKPEPVVAPEAG